MPFTTTLIDGGLDQITSPQAVKPGRLLDGINYESARTRGLRRMDGYEKFDGGPSPSSTGFGYLIVSYEAGVGDFFPLATVLALQPNTVIPGTDFNCVVTDTHYFQFLVNTELKTAVSIPLVGQDRTFTCGPDITVNFIGSYLLIHNATNTQMFIGRVLTITDAGSGDLTIRVKNVNTLAGSGLIAPWAAGVTLCDVNGSTINWGYLTVYMNEAALSPLDQYLGGSVSDGTITGTVVSIQASITAPAVNTNAQQMAQIAATYDLVAGTIQEVPGHGSVNGIFWLRDQLYATRDNINLSFNAAGPDIPDPGDVFYQGASLATSTFSCKMISYVQHGGAWADSNAGGEMMIYDEIGTPTIGVVLKNDTSGGTAMLLDINFGAAQTAGLYLASGQRGPLVDTRSWQWCDLGWNIHYSQCGIEGSDFIDQNTALAQTKTEDQYQTTPWHVGSAGTLPVGWTDTTGNFPDGMSAVGPSDYVFVNMTAASFKPATFEVNDFGFTDADIPPSATLIGIEIQINCGAIGLANQYSSSVIDSTFELTGIEFGSRPKITDPDPIPAAVSSTVAGAQYAKYTFSNYRDAGEPSGNSRVPTSLLGYSALTTDDLKGADFGVRYSVTLDQPTGTQNIQFGIDQLRVRATYLAQTNLIYFWNGQSYPDSVIGLGSTNLQLPVSKPFQGFMAIPPNEYTVVVEGAGPAEVVVYDGNVAFHGTVVSSPTANFTPDMVGYKIVVFGTGPRVPTTITGNYVAGTNTLSITSAGIITANMLDWVVEISGAAITASKEKTNTLRQRIATLNVGAQTATLVNSDGSSPTNTNSVTGINVINTSMTINTNVLSAAAGSPFAPEHVGWTVSVPGAGPLGVALLTTINSLNGSGQSVNLAATASFTVGPVTTALRPLVTLYPPTTAKITHYIDPTQVSVDTAFEHALPGSFSGEWWTVLAPIKMYAPLVTKIAPFGFGTSSSVGLVDAASTALGTTPFFGSITLGLKTLTTASPIFSSDMVGWGVSVLNAGNGAGNIPLISRIVTWNSATSVELADPALFTVAGVNSTAFPINTTTIGLPVLAQAVMHYNLEGSLSLGNASGMLYFAFYNNGVVGGTPIRPILVSEDIRTVPSVNAVLDGGVLDGSIKIATSSSAAAMNFMDPSSMMDGVMQPNGTLSPPSKYQSVTKNFYASSGFDAIYGVSGGGAAFYFDGVKTNSNGQQIVPGNFSRILTGLPAEFETPRGIVYHQGHIILSYYAGIIQSSNAANVLSFNPLLYDQSARLIGFGSNLTGMASINGDTLAVWTKSMIQMVQGNFNSNPSEPETGNIYTSTLSPTSGGIEYTIQPMANYMFCDFRGITALGATQKYGDFELGHYSAVIQSWIIPRVQTSSFFEGPDIGIINSVLIRNKNMVRYVFKDGMALSMTFLADNEEPQYTLQYYKYDDDVTPITWDVMQAFTESLGRDRIFGATQDGTGWVYELERGNSFQGGPITGYAIMVPDVAQTPYQNKIYSGFVLYGQAQDYASMTLSRSADYNDVDQATGLNVIDHKFGSLTAAPVGAVKFFKSVGTAPLSIEGTAINIRFDFSANDQFSHTLQAMAYTVEPADDQQE